MNSDKYSAPVIEQVDTAEVAVEEIPAPIVIQDVATEVEKTSNENFWRKELDNYLRYLNGEVGYRTNDERIKANVAFMQSVGRFTTYDYAEFEDCILYLIQALRNNPKAHAEGRFFRFISGCEKNYPLQAIATYRIFMTWCIDVANCWPTRVKRAKQTDIETMIVGMRKEAKDNLNLFVRKMANYAIK